MIANTLKSKIQLQEKNISQGALGQTITWKPVQNLYGRRIPLDVRAIDQYQQLNTVVTDKYIFRGTVEINIGQHRLVHGARTFEPQSSAKHFDGVTEVVVKEV